MKKLEKWRRTRSKGKWNFILKYGVLGWGGFTALGMTLFRWFEKGSPPVGLEVLGALVICSVMGLFLGAVMWSEMERRYPAASERKEEGYGDLTSKFEAANGQQGRRQ